MSPRSLVYLSQRYFTGLKHLIQSIIDHNTVPENLSKNEGGPRSCASKLSVRSNSW
jgi:hypothetical protein